MGTRAALVTGTVLSVAVASAWALAGCPGARPRLGGDLFWDYAQLADWPARDGRGLFAVTAMIYTACLLVSRWRRHRHRQRRGGA
jgi:hypothetical protein